MTSRPECSDRHELRAPVCAPFVTISSIYSTPLIRPSSLELTDLLSHHSTMAPRDSSSSLDDEEDESISSSELEMIDEYPSSSGLRAKDYPPPPPFDHDLFTRSPAFEYPNKQTAHSRLKALRKMETSPSSDFMRSRLF